MMKEELFSLKVQIEGLRKSLLLALDELADISELDANIISSQGVEFGAKHSRYMERLADLKRAEKILGRE